MKPARPSVAVVVCTHNGSKYLLSQLESIGSQRGGVDEVYLFDWNSTDRTREIAREWLSGISIPVRQLHEHDHAPGPARSFLDALRVIVANTRADLIFLSDQDDVWHVDKIETFVESFSGSQGQFDLAFSDARVVSGSGACLATSFYGSDSPYTKPTDKLDRSVLITNPAIGMTMCLNREWLARVSSTFDSYWIMHDWALMSLAWVTGARVRFVENALVDYRQHGGNMLGASQSRSLLSRATRMRLHARNVRRQIESLRDASKLPEAVEPATTELRRGPSRLSTARIAVSSVMLRLSYRLMLAGAFLLP